jgi:hypothetical protein
MFKAAFLEVATEHEAQLLNLWDDATAYTSYMLSGQGSFLATVAKQLSLAYFPGYWSLDAIFYRHKLTSYFHPSATYAESLLVALEHENNARTAHSEISKLSLFNCPLKVLITYPNPRDGETLLSEYADIACRADIFHDFSILRRQLVVLGLRNAGSISWQFKLYQDGILSSF